MATFFSSQMPLRDLAALCRRLATSLLAGVDIRTILAREAEGARGRTARRHLAALSRAVGQGEALADAVASRDGYFPPLFCEMVKVGEQSGHLGEIFAQLAEHYENQAQLRRVFLAAITWPVIQLGIALSVVGFLIWFTGHLSQASGGKIDILGFGLTGTPGLAIYAAIVAAAASVLFVLGRVLRQRFMRAGLLQRAVLRLPVLGRALQTLALARLAWSMHLTMQGGMELRRALRLSLESTRNARYIGRAGRIDAVVAGGNSLHEAFVAAGCFSHDFLDSLRAGEQSGRLVETLELLSRQYRDQARAALATLTTLASFAVWAFVAALIIGLIFRLFSFYIGVLNSVM